MGMMGSMGMMKVITPMLPINPIPIKINDPSSRLAATIKHCCPGKKPRSSMTSPSVSPTSFYPKATARLIR